MKKLISILVAAMFAAATLNAVAAQQDKGQIYPEPSKKAADKPADKAAAEPAKKKARGEGKAVDKGQIVPESSAKPAAK